MWRLFGELYGTVSFWLEYNPSKIEEWTYETGAVGLDVDFLYAFQQT